MLRFFFTNPRSGSGGERCRFVCVRDEDSPRSGRGGARRHGAHFWALADGLHTHAYRRSPTTTRVPFLRRESRGVDALLVMTGFEDETGKFRRQLVASNAPGRGAPAVTDLAKSMSPQLQLKPLGIPVPASDAFAAFEQENVKATRKQVAPAAAAFYQSEGVAKAQTAEASAP